MQLEPMFNEVVCDWVVWSVIRPQKPVPMKDTASIAMTS
jgi:hypothetical protein